jgi:hypothetical protein
MSAIARHKWYLAAIVLLGAALLLECVSKYYAGRGALRVARAVRSEPATERAQEARAYAGRSDAISIVGYCGALGGIICWVVSRRKAERGSQGALLVLLATYLIVSLVHV